jgi:predicted dehydrogenase
MKHIQLRNPFFNKKITIGMIGMGFISNVHVRAYRPIRGVVIKAIADSNQSLLTQKGKLLGIAEQYPDYRYMLEDKTIDVIDVMTPHFMHVQCVCDALRAGKTVICEKPVATNLKDLDMMTNTAKAVNKNIYIKHYLRYSSVNQKAQQLLSQKKIGRPYLIQCTFTSHSVQDYANPNSWRGNIKESGGGVFIDVGVHMLDLLQTMFGVPVATYAQCRKITTTLSQKGEDLSTALIEFPNDLMVSMNCTENDTAYGFRWEVRIYGTDGVLAITDKGNEEKVLQIIKGNKVVYDQTEHNWWEGANVSALTDIVHRIQENKEPIVSLRHARSVLETIIGSYESARLNKKVYFVHKAHHGS